MLQSSINEESQIPDKADEEEINFDEV